MNLRNLAPLLLSGTLAVACGGSDSGTDEPPATGPVESVEVTPADATVEEAKTVQLRAIARNAEGRELSGVTFSWRTTDETVATVDGSGLVTGLLPGSTQVVAEAEGHSGASRVEVTTGKVASVSIEPARSTIGLGQEITFQAVAKNDEGGALADRTATWSSSDDSIVAIGPDGTAWAKAMGEVTIEAEVEGVKGSLSLTVIDAVAARISIEPASITIAEAQTTQLTATVFDEDDQELDLQVDWISEDETVATVIVGQVRGVGPGSTTIVASVGDVRATAHVTVTEAEVVSVEINTQDPQVAIGESGRLLATARSADGAVNRPLEWTSSDPAIATVDSTGRVSGKAYGTTTITASYGDLSASVELNTHVSLSRLRAGGEHSCGLTPNTGRAICFGANDEHQLGTDTTETVLGKPISMMPVAVNAPADLRFTEIFAGGRHTCALTSDGAAWCWGDNAFGQLGIGEVGDEVRDPVKVMMPANTRFTTLALGDDFSCALAQTSNEVYCWGNEAEGRLGRDVATTPADRPGKTAMTERVSKISAGRAHACAVSEAGDAYCWGRNDHKQVGGAAAASVSFPSPVDMEQGQFYKDVAAGDSHTCGLLQGGDIYCWGANDRGQAGVAGSNDVATPTRVSTSLRFDFIVAGADFNCAAALPGNGAVQGDAYCWGGNNWGQLGDGRAGGYQLESVPSPVGFKSLSAGNFHVCGMSLSPERGYCWGAASLGQLGRRVVVNNRPGKVDGQL
ncbi:MAG TPA: Ig-like domain-containing protein [Vulgatibacter sp.]|nr:Ig-like domain-containing protein [Vulgatibacter sp.]